MNDDTVVLPEINVNSSDTGGGGSDTQHIQSAYEMVDRLNDAILFPLMTLMMAVAFLVFLWGAFEYVAKAESDEGRDNGRRHMLYGVIGFVVMLSALTILTIAANTFGVYVPNP